MYLFYTLRIFQICVSWWSFTGVWVTASLFRYQDSSEYSSQSLQCRCLDVHESSFDLQTLQSFSKLLGTVPSSSTIIGVTVTFLFRSLFSSLTSICRFFASFPPSIYPSKRQNPRDSKSLFFLLTNWKWGIFWLLKISREFYTSHSLEQILFYAYIK